MVLSGQTPRPVALPSGNNRYPLYKRKNNCDIGGFSFNVSSDYETITMDKCFRMYKLGNLLESMRIGFKFVYGVILQHALGSSINVAVNQ